MLPALLLSILGCRPDCQGLNEIPITGGDGATRKQVKRAVADFARWTGREELCVREIDIRALNGKKSGHFNRLNSAIAITPHDPYRTTIHELCHALDSQEGHSDADLFTDSGKVLRSRKWQRAEAFAEACETGPPDALKNALSERCGLSPLTPQQKYLLNNVFEQVPVAVVTDGTSVSRSVRLRSEDAEPVAMASDGDSILLLRESDDQDVAAYMDLYDVWTGRPTLTLPVRGELLVSSPAVDQWGMVADGRSDLVFVSYSLNPSAWVVSTTAGDVLAVDIGPRFDAMSGSAFDGIARVTFGQPSALLWSVSLQDGAVLSETLDELFIWVLERRDGTYLGTTSGDVVNVTTGERHVAPTGSWAGEVVILGDDIVASYQVGDGEHIATGFLRFDVANGVWTVVGDACAQRGQPIVVDGQFATINAQTGGPMLKVY